MSREAWISLSSEHPGGVVPPPRAGEIQDAVAVWVGRIRIRFDDGASVILGAFLPLDDLNTSAESKSNLTRAIRFVWGSWASRVRSGSRTFEALRSTLSRWPLALVDLSMEYNCLGWDLLTRAPETRGTIVPHLCRRRAPRETLRATD